MRIAIHQPNFFPWMGYFYKMAQSDTFVLLDHVQFTKKAYTKRVKIHKTGNWEEDQYLTIPLQKHSDHAAITSLKIVDNQHWQKKIKTQIEQTYRRAPYFHQLAPILETFFDQPPASNSFSEFTISIIQYMATLLQLHPKWIISKDLDINYSGIDVNFDISKHLNAQTYISGMGAKKYQDEDLFTNSKIQLVYSDYQSYFQTLDLPSHFLNKSSLSYLAHYDVDYLIETFFTKMDDSL
ncbi:MAG: WbqC family protein [Bacteroidota bacterium]